MKMTMIRTYSELMKLSTFEERYRYLKLAGKVAEETFGFDRYLNQSFYRTREWKQVRDQVIARDLGCDLGDPDREIDGLIIVHHMNPIRKDDILSKKSAILDPEFLICTSKRTHNAIHYGDESLLYEIPKARTKNDTCPWKR